MYLQVLIQCCSFCSVVILEETDQINREVFYAIVQIHMIIYTFLLQEELYSYCNRVKRSILEVNYIALYRSYYPDR